MSEVIQDPTAFRPMAVTARADIAVGYEIEPLTRRMSLDKSRIYQGWPQVRNRHTDYEVAQATGLPVPNINGGQSAELLGALFIRFFGAGFIGGTLSIKFIGSVALDDVLTARGVVRGSTVEKGRTRLEIEAWVEDQTGRKVLVGTAAGYAPA